MRLLLIHPGADIATVDVYNGLLGALTRAGHEVRQFRLDWRITRYGRMLANEYRRAKRSQPDVPGYNTADVLFHAHLGLLEQALDWRPDWVLIVSAMYTPAKTIELLKRAGARIAVVGTEDPYDSENFAQILPFVDVAWTNERSSVAYLRQANPNTHYLPHAYDPDKHYPFDWFSHTQEIEPDMPAHDVVFVGSAFEERIQTLAAVDWSGVDLGLYGQWQALGSRHPLRRYVRGGVVDNTQAAALYRRARIGLNLYRTTKGWGRNTPKVTNAESLNPRALELAACGVFTISDYRPEVAEVFGDLVPTFSNPEALGQLVRRYLADESARRSLADRLPAAVAGRTFDDMAVAIVSRLAQ
jgi:glycosyltransferase involved in cell wall biosynthesis